MRLAKLCGDDILYCRQSDEYFIWDETGSKFLPASFEGKRLVMLFRERK
jgi:hypothetical protein